MLVEVSIGEAIDKLTILDIKKDKIIDIEKKRYINEEYTYLQNYLQDLLLKYEYYYCCLKRINLQIWELQDQLRCINNEDESVIYGRICEKVILLNDSRFMIKNKINLITNSKFKEQKGYQKRAAKIFFQLNDRNILHIIYPIVRFLSFHYDELLIVVNRKDQETIKSLFLDDLTIETILVEDINDYIVGDCFDLDDPNKLLSNHTFLNHVKYSDNHLLGNEITTFFKNLNLDPRIYLDYNDIKHLSQQNM
jgi:hypothetical protein